MTPHEESWLALRLVEGLGAKTLERLLDHFPDVETVLEAGAADLTRACGLRPDLAQRIAVARDQPAFHAELEHLSRHGVSIVPRNHPHYPGNLLGIDLPPPLLFARGVLPLPPGPVLGIVGTRACSRYGEKAARHLIDGLARLRPDAVILSGLARGIDTIAHGHALACGLTTAAVLGTGLARFYPPENSELAETIAGQGPLFSEFPMGERPRARNFPIRNRTLSGMADVVLVVEAADRSGALITANFALAQGRPVLALPGNIDQPGSKVTNRIIRSGEARLVQHAEDVAAALDESRRPPVSAPPTQLDWFGGSAPSGPESIPATGSAQQPLHARRSAPAAAQGDKGRILQALSQGPLHPDDLAGETSLPIEKLVGLLLELELSGDIVQTADNNFTLA